MWNFLRTKCLALLGRFRKDNPVFSTAQQAPFAGRAAWIGSMRDSVEIRGDIISPANEQSEWEALRG
jgi:hypothetical protein